MTSSSSSNVRRILDKSELPATIYELPQNQRIVMQFMLQARELAYEELVKKNGTLPAPEQLTQKQIDDALYELVRTGYLMSFVEGGQVIYMAQRKTFGKPDKRDETRMWKRGSSVE